MQTSQIQDPSSTPLSSILSSNQQLHTRYSNCTAIFTGATQGIGLGTLHAFLRHIARPKAFIIGRSRSKFASELKALQKVNSAATLIFIEAQLSLISEVDRVCAEIKAQSPPTSVAFLSMSQGYAPFGERKWTSEGLDEVMSLVYYGRMRMAERLIADGVMAPDARVISVGGAGKEGAIFRDDLEMKDNWSVYAFRSHITSVISLTVDNLARDHPGMSFIHNYPGMVNTNLLHHGGASFLFGIYLALLRTYISICGITPEESGERMLWMATSERFAKGSFSILEDGSASQSKELREYRRDAELSEAIRRHLNEIYERALASRS